MLSDPEARRAWRRQHVDKFLTSGGVSRDCLAVSTLTCLDSWARQERLVIDQPSANHAGALTEPCKAVESELACRLGPLPGLEFFKGSIPLGGLAEKLRRVKPDDSCESRMASRRIDPEFVSSVLADRLSDLARLRKDTSAAHGGVNLRSATSADSQKACIVATEIFCGIGCSLGKSSA